MALGKKRRCFTPTAGGSWTSWVVYAGLTVHPQGSAADGADAAGSTSVLQVAGLSIPLRVNESALSRFRLRGPRSGSVLTPTGISRRSGSTLPAAGAYKNGCWVDVRTSDINDYIKKFGRADFTAKDFRTWHATVLAGVALAVSEAATSDAARRRAISRAVQEVAHYLGNTPAVCRAAYIDPRVFDRYRAGVTIAPALDGLAERSPEDGLATEGRIESAVAQLLE